MSERSGSGWIHYDISSCGLFETVDEALARMTEPEKKRYYERMASENGIHKNQR